MNVSQGVQSLFCWVYYGSSYVATRYRRLVVVLQP